MPHVVIVAGGLGSRLAPLTNNVPKFLVNTGKQTGYVEQVKYWLNYADFTVNESIRADVKNIPGIEDSVGSLTVIVHSNYAKLISEYHKLYFPNVPLIVKTVDEASGSAHAIISSCDHLNMKSVFFQWCDVMPAVDLPLNEMVEMYNGANVVFTNYDHPNRYALVKKGPGWADLRPALDVAGRGGIFGLYYVSHFHTDIIKKHWQPGQDFVELIEHFGPIREHEVSSIIDWGDKPKLERTRDTADAAREFNSITFHGDLVLKSALNEQGEKLIQREINWYNSMLSSNSSVSRPTHYPHPTEASFVMSKVHGVPVFQFWKTLDSENRELVLERVFEQMDKLHRSVVITGPYLGNDIQEDIKIEAHDKLLNRYNEIEGVINSFGHISSVNGWLLQEQDPRKTIQKLYKAIAEHYDNETNYNFIHGDLQMSNTMINPDTMEVMVIDPRGYFGKSELYGLADYDVAKLLYSLSGYDLFNYSRDFHISEIKNGNLKFEIPRPNVSGCKEIINKRFNTVHYMWLAVCWIGLAQYIKCDPVKSVCAHYYGLQLAEQILEFGKESFGLTQ